MSSSTSTRCSTSQTPSLVRRRFEFWPKNERDPSSNAVPLSSAVFDTNNEKCRKQLVLVMRAPTNDAVTEPSDFNCF